MTRIGTQQQISASVLAKMQKVKDMSDNDVPPPDIAAALNLSLRTVHRYREKLGIKGKGKPTPISSEEDAEMRRLIVEDGWPVTEVAKKFNRHVYTLYKRYPGLSQVRNGLADTKALRMRLGLKIGGDE